ncbi:hypothetical protein [Salinibacterium sp. ZJ77]|uniref:hypothetical protein n=1 Tax=Salinibacterium sp. ZJ77 TaxID=2708337 RepID=UPI001FB8D38B|nr:hypothetical protein [Salinibacterium sp. ZJ77]
MDHVGGGFTYPIVAALVAIGLALIVLVSSNISAQMDRVDREGLGGNIFAPDIVPLGLLALATIGIGVVALIVANGRGRKKTRRHAG